MEQNLREYRYHHEAASIRWGATTHVGLRRQINEDSLIASFPVFLIADGMGGHQAGDRASSLALGTFEQLLGPGLPKADQVESAIQRAFGAVLGAGAENAGTTLTGGVLTQDDCGIQWYFVNIGDSRTYMLRGGQLEQISVDHSVV
ncbi:PP2C family protein-serine/threonine phosphatase, partial [Agrococcus casei]